VEVQLKKLLSQEDDPVKWIKSGSVIADIDVQSYTEEAEGRRKVKAEYLKDGTFVLSMNQPKNIYEELPEK
jgi:hypothetical protein